MPSTIKAVDNIPTLERALELADMSPEFLHSCIDEQARKVNGAASLIRQALDDRATLICIIRGLVDGDAAARDHALEVLAHETKPCPACEGKGLVDADYSSDETPDSPWIECKRCDGGGRLPFSGEADANRT